jgi:hypothetical protein
VTTFEIEPPRALFATPPRTPEPEVLAAAQTLRDYASNERELNLVRQSNCFDNRSLHNLVYEYRAWCWLQAQCDRVLAQESE